MANYRSSKVTYKLQGVTEGGKELENFYVDFKVYHGKNRGSGSFLLSVKPYIRERVEGGTLNTTSLWEGYAEGLEISRYSEKKLDAHMASVDRCRLYYLDKLKKQNLKDTRATRDYTNATLGERID